MEKIKKFKTIEELLNIKSLKCLDVNKINEFQKEQLTNIIEEFNKIFIHNNFKLIVDFIINNIECDWITRIKLIKEKFNRNSSSLESFILRYGEVEGQKQFDEKNEKCVVTLEKLIVKLGEDEGNKIWDEIRKSKRSVSLEIMTERYGEEEGLKRWNSYLEKWRVGIQKKKEKGDWKNGSTLERRIEIYGEEEGTRIWNENSIRMSKILLKRILKSMAKKKVKMNMKNIANQWIKQV